VAAPARGEVWLVDLDPTRGHEQAGRRPALVISTTPFNHGPADLVIELPITTKERRIPFHIEVNPPEGGGRQRSFIKCEDIRSVAQERLVAGPWGVVSSQTMQLVADRLQILLEL
jgi:mRNA interferase MazF